MIAAGEEHKLCAYVNMSCTASDVEWCGVRQAEGTYDSVAAT